MPGSEREVLLISFSVSWSRGAGPRKFCSREFQSSVPRSDLLYRQKLTQPRDPGQNGGIQGRKSVFRAPISSESAILLCREALHTKVLQLEMPAFTPPKPGIERICLSLLFLIFFTVDPYCPRAEFGSRSDSLVPQRPFQTVASLSMVPKVFGGLTGHRSLSWKNDPSCQSHPFCFTGHVAIT